MRTPRTVHSTGYRYSPSSPGRQRDSDFANLAIVTLCDAMPTGAMVLDSAGRLIFSNREAQNLVERWNSNRPATKQSARTRAQVPPEIVAACERLKCGKGIAGARSERPQFGGRVLVRHPRVQNLSAVVALERSHRDRRIAVFCVLVHDRLRENLVAGCKEQLAMLSIAERRVAKLVADGLRNSEIAAALGKSTTTVKSQLSAVFLKLQIRTRTQLATLLRAI